MNPEIYFDRMRETSEMVDEVIFDAVEPLKRQNCDMYDAVVSLSEKRKGLPKSRAHLARESYVICNGGDDGGWVCLAAAVELELNSMYYKNQVFDSKADCSIGDRNSVLRNWIADSYSSDLAKQVLQKFYPECNKLGSLLRESNMVCAEGFWIDLFRNVYSETLDFNFDEKISLCDDRMYKMNASFYEKIAMMGAIVSGETDETIVSALGNFGRNLGMGLQAVNDIADFVPPRINAGTTEKTGEDAYRDVMFEKMTYPSIWLLHNGSRKGKGILEEVFEKGFGAELFELEDLISALVHDGAINFAKRKVTEYGNKAKSGLREKFSKEERGWSAVMCAMFQSNRYYNALKEFE